MTGMPPPPPPALPYGFEIKVGPGVSTVLADMDFEGWSAAGFVWHGPTAKKPLGYWSGPPGAAQGKKGLNVIGSRVYSEHPSTEALTFSYDLKDGYGKRRWKPGQPNPQPLFDHLASGKFVEAHGAGFELNFWNEVCVHRYGWPPLDGRQLRCSMAKARAFGLPAALADVGAALNLDTQKDKAGKELMKIFSWPKDPTKKDPRWRIFPHDSPEQFARYEDYCDTDIVTEAGVSARCPDLIPQELDYWLADQAINRRGIGVDMAAVADCIAVVNEVLKAYDEEMFSLIGLRTSQAKKLVEWMADNGVRGSDGRPVKSLAAEELEFLFEQRHNYPHPVGRVLEIRGLTASASVKKVFSMANHANRNARLCDLFIYHGARTGRDTHADVQPGNLPKAGPDLRWCDNQGICRRPYAKHFDTCPWCGCSAAFSSEASPVEGDKGWCFEGVEHVLEILRLRSMSALEYFFGDALLCVSGVVRSLMCAAPGNRLICSDYSSIEAVVQAMLTGEEWRIETFRRGECIYLHSAAKILGKTYEYYQANGFKKHPDRKIGKIAELALGFSGWINALYAFGYDGTDAEAKNIVIPWRAASPAFVEMWGGQYRGFPWAPTSREFFGLEGCAVQAVLTPGSVFGYRGITYQVIDDVLYCTLLSGRRMAYHQPRLWHGSKRDGWVESYSLTYMTWNTNALMGAKGWVRMETFGGRLFENVVQATARDIMAHAVVNLEAAGYRVVLRVHDEVAAEVPEGFGSLAEFEAILTQLPEWARDWPIRAEGWEGVRYHK